MQETNELKKHMNQEWDRKEIKGIKYKIPPKESPFHGLTIRENPDEAFENAISRGMSSPEDWMYMYSKNEKDYFKHKISREYKAYPQLGLGERLFPKKIVEGRGKAATSTAAQERER